MNLNCRTRNVLIAILVFLSQKIILAAPIQDDEYTTEEPKSQQDGSHIVDLDAVRARTPKLMYV